MANLFPRGANALFRTVLAGAVAIAVAVPATLMALVRSPLGTGERELVAQPLQFDHRHHSADEGIECRYCHYDVERSAFAGIPPTSLCMGCHAQIWNRSPTLDAVRESVTRNAPIAWQRVNNLPDFVYFDHSIHVNKGVGCETCHGRVDRMATVMQAQPLTMRWCLDCHRNPEPRLRPRNAVTEMGWQPGTDREALGRELAARYAVDPRTDCWTCHR